MPDADVTGAHPLPPHPTMVPPPAPSYLSPKVLAVLFVAVAGVGGGSGYASSSAESARAEQRVVELERRMESVEVQVAGVEPLRREVAAMSARLSAEVSGVGQRLARIEQQLDRQADRHAERVRGSGP